MLSGLALAIPETIINAVMGPELSVISASIVIMAVIIGCAKIMPPNDPEYAVKQTGEVPKVSGGEGLIAAMPFILIFVLLLLTSKLFLQLMVLLHPLKHLYLFTKVLVQNPTHSYGLQLLVS